LRGDSELEIGGADFFINSLRILSGRLLSVFAKRQPSRGSRIRPAPVIRHTNTELRLLENIVGRDVSKRLRKAYIKYWQSPADQYQASSIEAFLRAT
jgi:hypothetical protein